MNPTIVINLNAATASLAGEVAAALGCPAHGFRTPVVAGGEVFEGFADHLRAQVTAGSAVVALCAVPVLVRVLGPLVESLESPPAVVAVSPDGRFVVPVLGAHRATPSANALAREIADAIGAQAMVTTATDGLLGLALDAPPTGWRLGNPGDYKAFAAMLAERQSLRIHGSESPPDWLANSGVTVRDDAPLALRLGIETAAGSAEELVLHPARLAIGVGCERHADPEELETLARKVLADANLSPAAVAVVVSLDLKSDEGAVLQLAARLGVPARFFDATTLEAERERLANPSDVVFAEVGCHGVAEGAALAAVGANGSLLVEKHRSARATCAVAIATDIIDPLAVGGGQGVLTVVGHGPGNNAMFTPEARTAITSAEHLVGYRLYLDIAERLVGGYTAGQTRHDYDLGEERDRVRAALALAATGRRIALVCSGDPGVYALATLAVEQMAASESPAEQRVTLNILPGVSAAQAAAARAGAPLGHDFCFISLSDLLTPLPTIIERVQAALAGDFVIAFYNPVSQRRREPFERALALLREGRPPHTPVILARALGRDEEDVRTLRLDALRTDDIDMLTTVVVGSRQTRTHRLGSGRELVYTPRGYDVSGQQS